MGICEPFDLRTLLMQPAEAGIEFFRHTFKVGHVYSDGFVCGNREYEIVYLLGTLVVVR